MSRSLSEFDSVTSRDGWNETVVGFQSSNNTQHICVTFSHSAPTLNLIKLNNFSRTFQGLTVSVPAVFSKAGNDLVR